VTNELFSQLRTATAAFHRRLDAAIDVCGDGLTLEQYRSLLVRFYGIFAMLEPRLTAVRGLDALDLNLDLARCNRTAWLAEDLDALDVRLPDRILDIASGPYRHLVTGVPEALGCLYVIEGAGLGGQVIVPCVRRQLGLTAVHGCRFFAGHGAATGERWRRLRAEADNYARRTQTHALIVQSAVEVFGMFVDWFSEDVNGDRVERCVVAGGTVQH
jgi:Heme oxygenase